MNLRGMLAELIGAEIQKHTITLNGKSVDLFFKQFTDEEGARIFAPSAPEETDEDRGRRISIQSIAASVCDESGTLSGTEDEVAKLPAIIRAVLFDAVAETNNLNTVKRGSEVGNAIEADADGSDSGPKN